MTTLPDKKKEALVKFRDSLTMAAEALNEYIDTLAPKEVKDNFLAVPEETFTIQKFEPQKSSKLGDFEVTYKQNNIPEKFGIALDILRNSKATIQARYHCQGYQFSYWLYGEDKIYRQKLKPKEV